jgi:catechol 2,3-dioxygenase-like lactoylglutathione lyase family enzyme
MAQMRSNTDDLRARDIGSVALLVRDYDEAIEWFVRKLGFELLEDRDDGGGKRWVRVGPTRSGGTALLLARAANEAQAACVGAQSGGRVFLFLHTDDFWRDYRDMRASGVVFEEQPREEAYGTVAVFRDLYGNRWDLLQESS